MGIGEIENEPESETNPGGVGQQIDRMDILQKLQGLSVLRLEEALSSKDAVDSVPDGCGPQDAHLNATPPKDPFNATMEDYASSKENTSIQRCCGNAELLEVINGLYKKTEALEKKQIASDKKLLLLEGLVKDSGRKFEHFKHQIEELQFKYNSLVGRPSIFLIGGYNGTSWSSSLDSFYPTADRLVPLEPMSSARPYASVAGLKDQIYVFGGGDGSSWSCTVECYNIISNEWIACPGLNREKGSLTGATLDGSIFAIGGGNGDVSFSEVELFEPALGRWIYSPPMLHRRFAPAAAGLNGVLYAIGGSDAGTCLKTAERYDPREGFWVRLPSMTTRRQYHSVAVLGEALYALGGCDGDGMLSSVEIFDPCANSWRIGSPLSSPRGCAAAVTLNDSLYLIGGLLPGRKVVDTVEVYKEGFAWSIPGLKAIGNRAFLSAIVM